MKLELFNSTNMVKQVPKYNYNGKIRIPAQGVYPIEEYMIAFYRPYARIGVYVRSVEVPEDVEKEVEKIIPTPEPVLVVAEEILKQEESIPEVVEPEQPEVAIETNTEGTSSTLVEGDKEKEEVKKYTEAELQELRVSELKDLAASMGIDLGDVKKKAPYIEAIIAKQSV